MADSQKKTVLITGGTGYVGSHTVDMLLEDGYNVVVIDNFSKGCPESIKRIEALRGTSIPCYDVDMCNMSALLDVFSKHPEISVVIHFAAMKAVGESVEEPLEYFRVNVRGTMNLIQAMSENGVTSIIFSSSATYGDPRYAWANDLMEEAERALVRPDVDNYFVLGVNNKTPLKSNEGDQHTWII